MAKALPLTEAIPRILNVLLARYPSAVPEKGLFPDLVVVERVSHRSSLDGSESEVLLELAVRAMNPAVDSSFEHIRFVAIRARSPRTPGFISVSLYHGTREELWNRLQNLFEQPQDLVEEATALLEGLAVESDPDIWN